MGLVFPQFRYAILQISVLGKVPFCNSTYNITKCIPKYRLDFADTNGDGRISKEEWPMLIDPLTKHLKGTQFFNFAAFLRKLVVDDERRDAFTKLYPLLSLGSSVKVSIIADFVNKVERRGHGACFHKTGLQRKEVRAVSRELFSDFMIYQVRAHLSHFPRGTCC